VSVIVVLLAATASGLLTGLVRMEHERAAELRTRQLDAADDFFQSFAVALGAGRKPWLRLMRGA